MVNIPVFSRFIQERLNYYSEIIIVMPFIVYNPMEIENE